MARRLLPAPETVLHGASENGYWEVFFHGIHPDRGADMRLKVTGDMDPGYGFHGKMLGKAALCLALDAPATGGGFWTPLPPWAASSSSVWRAMQGCASNLSIAISNHGKRRRKAVHSTQIIKSGYRAI